MVEGKVMSYHGLAYIISNLTMWIISKLKDFRIDSCMRVGGVVYKFTLGMKHPVQLINDNMDMNVPSDCVHAGQ